MHLTRPSTQSEFCIHLHDESLNHSGLPEQFSRSGWLVGQVVLVVQVVQVVQVVLVIKFVNAYGLHGLNNQIIEKTWDVMPVNNLHTHTGK